MPAFFFFPSSFLFFFLRLFIFAPPYILAMKSPGRGASTQGSDDAFPGWTSGVWKKREAVRHLWGNRLLLSLFYTVPLLPAAALGCQGCHFYNYPPLYILTTLPLLDPAHRLFSSNPFFRAGKRNFPLSVLPNFPGILPPAQQPSSKPKSTPRPDSDSTSQPKSHPPSYRDRPLQCPSACCLSTSATTCPSPAVRTTVDAEHGTSPTSADANQRCSHGTGPSYQDGTRFECPWHAATQHDAREPSKFPIRPRTGCEHAASKVWCGCSQLRQSTTGPVSLKHGNARSSRPARPAWPAWPV